MFSRAGLIELHRHMEWADGEVWRAVLRCEAARTDATMAGLLLHLHTVQRAFLSIWTSEPVVFPDAGSFPALDDMYAWSRSHYAPAHAFLESAADGALSGPIVMPWAAQLAQQLGREPGTPTLAETIFQVTSHSTYHRGQINARLRALGGEPPLVDYIAWIWFDRPAAAVGATR